MEALTLVHSSKKLSATDMCNIVVCVKKQIEVLENSIADEIDAHIASMVSERLGELRELYDNLNTIYLHHFNFLLASSCYE